MTHIRGYTCRRNGKRIKVRGHTRRVYKGYKSRRSYMADHAHNARHKPAKKYKRHIGNRGDW